jgi:hypothetical protein
MRNRRPLVVLVSAAALFVAGCGGSSSSSSPSSSAPAATSSSSSASSATASSSSAAAAIGGELAQAVAVCKQTVDTQASIPASLKSKLHRICDLAGSGNQAAVKKATHEVCVDIVKQRVPASGQAAAEASCPAA